MKNIVCLDFFREKVYRQGECSLFVFDGCYIYTPGYSHKERRSPSIRYVELHDRVNAILEYVHGWTGSIFQTKNNWVLKGTFPLIQTFPLFYSFFDHNFNLVNGTIASISLLLSTSRYRILEIFHVPTNLLWFRNELPRKTQQESTIVPFKTVSFPLHSN